MKKVIFLGLVSVLLLPLLVISCGSEKATTAPAGGGEDKTIELTLDDFAAQHNIAKDVALTTSGTLTVKLGSNPTTGYTWSENATMLTAEKIVVQQSYNYVEPTATDIVGASGTSVWTFKAVEAGTGIIELGYGRPWEGGEKDTYTLTINVTVK